MPDDLQARPRLIGNERVRRTGTFLNNLAGSCDFAGVIAPVASLLYTIATHTRTEPWNGNFTLFVSGSDAQSS